MLRHFEDPQAGGFFFTADDHEQLILRPKTFGDDATPAGNGVAARLVIRLGVLPGETRYLDAAERTLRSAWAALEKYPHGHTSLLMALDEFTDPPAIIVLRGPAEDLDTWRSELDKLYDPRRLVIAIPSDATDLPAGLADKKPQGRAVAYLCRGMTCSAPLATLSIGGGCWADVNSHNPDLAGDDRHEFSLGVGQLCMKTSQGRPCGLRDIVLDKGTRNAGLCVFGRVETLEEKASRVDEYLGVREAGRRGELFR